MTSIPRTLSKPATAFLFVAFGALSLSALGYAVPVILADYAAQHHHALLGGRGWALFAIPWLGLTLGGLGVFERLTGLQPANLFARSSGGA